MKNILNFLIKVGKLKGKKRRGWLIHKIKDAETTGEHIFHLTFLAWILGKDRGLNLERVIKMALVHDLCEVYSPDLTSYDAAAIKEKGRVTINDILAIKPIKGRPTNEQRKKMERVKQVLEKRAMKKILSNLPPNLKKEIGHLWLDYENGITAEGRFVKQADRVMNFLQGLEYSKKHGRIEYHLWVRRIKEVVDDPMLLEFVKIVESKFRKKRRR